MAVAVVVQIGGVAVTIAVGGSSPSATAPAVEQCEATLSTQQCVMLKGHGPWHLKPLSAGAVSWHNVRS